MKILNSIKKFFIKIRAPLKYILLGSTIVGALFAGVALADGPTAVSLTDLAGNVDHSVNELATVLTDISLIAGIGFIMASFFKFHQHKLNPTQVPLSQGVTLILIGAGLTLFPTMLPTAKQAIFGKNASIAKTGGGQIHGLISGGGSGGK